ncbi:MAG: Ykof family thiamine-binding protein [Actinomycetia bacterium]|nr:Ykof family thiamine-binding protein [Actinomycetes bacterium]
MSEAPGYMSPEVVGCQFSVYPLRQAEIGGPIEAAVQAARREGCTVRVGNLSTLMSGSEDQVFAALRAAFRAAQRQGPAVMTATLAAGMPTDELVGRIQQEIEGRGPSGKDDCRRVDGG